MHAFVEDSLEAELLDYIENIPPFTRQQVRYLESRFNANGLLSQEAEAKSGGPVAHLGFLRGIREVMDHVTSVYRDQQSKES
ncbi:hypothetical protein DBR00_02495 [Pseudomonas sp. HMWF032]|uniref:hypothetical protein n=1 Tax=Pseudomonas sp. HMWF032 TaxID=2056866 RepID=UPI000D343921|nr:hypothetical protein [Pseudomonas sp. HMWF032]PTS86444.1 hypothetical protein DBR00_02495 [Pseudomonas sp. HMWF032]PTT81367.1 hypothetical protein DBR41_17035 [Pseudomonas sp. HMWF010]